MGPWVLAEGTGKRNGTKGRDKEGAVRLEGLEPECFGDRLLHLRAGVRKLHPDIIFVLFTKLRILFLFSFGTGG
jgi:hypothetical protein